MSASRGAAAAAVVLVAPGILLELWPLVAGGVVAALVAVWFALRVWAYWHAGAPPAFLHRVTRNNGTAFTRADAGGPFRSEAPYNPDDAGSMDAGDGDAGGEEHGRGR